MRNLDTESIIQFFDVGDYHSNLQDKQNRIATCSVRRLSSRQPISGVRILLMSLNFMDFGIPLLKALVKLGEKAKSAKAYPEVKKIMDINPEKFPEEGFNRIKNIQLY